MRKLESTLVFQQKKLRKGHRYYFYEGREQDERGRRKIGGLYILQKEIGKNPPGKLKLVLKSIENDNEPLIAFD